MKILLVLSLDVILNSVKLSSQFDCLPNGEPIPGVPRSGTSNSPTRHQFPESSIPSAEPPPHARSRSPPARTHSSARHTFLAKSSSIFGFPLSDLGLIRLIPNNNPLRRFEIRRYTFPADKPIQLLGLYNKFRPMPTEERNVLTTSTGDAVAILETPSILRGIYNLDGKRAGINIESGAVFELTPELANETPLGSRFIVSKNFRIINVNAIRPDQ